MYDQGSACHNYIFLLLVFEPDGKLEVIAGATRDITEHRQQSSICSC
ncbi:two-component system sensor protein [Xanthomonas fragariae]|uniref:Two-component system sensor protein n=1 Tax=Xanthomonas fragariae TaxID=48664 RepID=A0A1Y6HIQ2_9XANT|nr:two-component system sensor protein [Xanthomonas fragariae]SMR00393.1 hypothetical protein PD885_03171 [Xanthomonas fragariae]SMR02160.1 two-component system sensor protein [Xanthomonas fragariae]